MNKLYFPRDQSASGWTDDGLWDIQYKAARNSTPDISCLTSTGWVLSQRPAAEVEFIHMGQVVEHIDQTSSSYFVFISRK